MKAQGASRLQVMSFGWRPLDGVEPQALGLTYWFDAEPGGDPYPVSIRFAGRRAGVQGRPTSRDSFSSVVTVDRVLPGSGRVAVTTRIVDVAPGEWHATATPVAERPAPARGSTGAPFSRRPKLPRGSAVGTTAFAPVVRVRAPGVRLGAWPALVTLGTVVALVVQSLLAAHLQLPVGRLLLIWLSACVVGVIGAKVYYVLTHRKEKHTLLTVGMSIQGFVLAAIGTAAVGTIVAGLPIGQVLDITAPGLLFGMTIGRFGCFLGGCCAGRATAARWGLWSSDRRIGVRRIPVQLFESALAGSLGAVALLATWTQSPSTDGVVFVAATAAYTFGRQLLFPMRDLARATTHGRTLTMTLTGLVLAAALAVAVIR